MSVSALDNLIRRKQGGFVKHTSGFVDRLLAVLSDTPLSVLRDPSLAFCSAEYSAFLWKSFGDTCTDSYSLVLAAAVTSHFWCHSAVALGTPDQLRALIIRLVQIHQRPHTIGHLKVVVLRFLNVMVQNLATKAIKKCMAPMFSIISWFNLEYKPVDYTPEYEKALDGLSTLSKKEKMHIIGLASFPHALCEELCQLKNDCKSFEDHVFETITLLCTMLSQLPTRKYLKTIIESTGVIPALGDLHPQESKIVYHVSLLEYYLSVSIDEFTLEPKASNEILLERTGYESMLLTALFTEVQDKLGDFLASVPSLSANLKATVSELSNLDDEELDALLRSVRRSVKAFHHPSRRIKVLVLVYPLVRPSDPLSILNKQQYRFTHLELQEALTEGPTHYPRMGPQFLSIIDFVLRNFQIIRADVNMALSQHLIETASRFTRKKNQQKLIGTSRHAVQIKESKVKLVPVKSPSGIKKQFLTEVKVHFDAHQSSVSAVEWNSLRAGDTVFFAHVGVKEEDEEDKSRATGLTSVRSATVLKTNGTPLHPKRPVVLTLLICPDFFLLHEKDELASFESGLYDLLIKCPEHLKNHADQMAMISRLAVLSDFSVPPWFREALLGYGDADSGHWTKLPISQAAFRVGKLSMKSVQEALPGFELVDKRPLTRKRHSDGADVPRDDVGVVGFKIEGQKIIALPDERGILTDCHNLAAIQLSAIFSGIHQGLTIVTGPSGTGKRTVANRIARINLANHEEQKTLIVSKNRAVIDSMMQNLATHVDWLDLHTLCRPEHTDVVLGKARERLGGYLEKVRMMAGALVEQVSWADTFRTADSFYQAHVKPRWIKFLHLFSKNRNIDFLVANYPFAGIFDFSIPENASLKEAEHIFIAHYIYKIQAPFEQISVLGPIIESSSGADQLLRGRAKIIGATIADLMCVGPKLAEQKLAYSNIIILEASQLTEFETVFPLLLMKKGIVRRVAMFGDERSIGPAVFSSHISDITGLSQSLFTRLISSGTTIHRFNTRYQRHPEITALLNRFYREPLSSSMIPKTDLSVGGVKITACDPNPDYMDAMPQSIVEAQKLLEELKLLIDSGKTDILVITPLDYQALLIKMTAQAQGIKCPAVLTLEQARGKEAEHVLVSLASRDYASLKETHLVAAFSTAVTTVYIFCSPVVKERLRSRVTG